MRYTVLHDREEKKLTFDSKPHLKLEGCIPLWLRGYKKTAQSRRKDESDSNARAGMTGQRWRSDEGVREVRLREWERLDRGGGLWVSPLCQTNVCLSVALGRHVSDAPEWAASCSQSGSLPWPIITPLQEDTGCMITMSSRHNSGADGKKHLT